MRSLSRWQNNVGKAIGGSIYVHKGYESEVVPSNILNAAKMYLDGFTYSIIKYVPKTGAITFTQSPDFDTAHEPVVGKQLLVKADGTKKIMKPLSDPWIYHHKWLWVKDDYSGFDTEQSKQRSASWTSLPNIDYSRIGKQSYWNNTVIPRLSQ